VYAQTLHNDKVFIIGGGQVYAQALPFVDKLYLTLVDTDAEGDTYFPRYEAMFTRTVHTEDREHRGINYRWVDIER
jgi:dihydrofolate reductase